MSFPDLSILSAPLAQVLRMRENRQIDALRLWPRQATTMAAEVDWLFLAVIGLTVFFTTLIFVLIVVFALKYRRRPGHRATQFPTNNWLEVIWTVIPTVIVLGIFAWSSVLYTRLNTVPKGAMRIDVVGKQWMWKLQHPAGRREINELHVPTGVPIELVMTSEDTIHSFYLPAARVKHDVLPGRYTSIWFQASTPGTYRLLCAEYCGTDHSLMGGKLVVMRPAEYAAWLNGDTDEPQEVDVPPARAGAALFSAQGCASCHGQYGPTLAGIYGRKQKMSSGEMVEADDAYLRESILYPNAKMVAGYPPLMPTYAGRLSEEQVLQLIAYIRSLKGVPIAVDAATTRTIVPQYPSTQPSSSNGATE